MSGWIWDGGSYDFPEPDYDPRDDVWDDFVYAERESFDAHYADEIDGRAEYPSEFVYERESGLIVVEHEDTPEPEPAQLALFVVLDAEGTHLFGIAY